MTGTIRTPIAHLLLALAVGTVPVACDKSGDAKTDDKKADAKVEEKKADEKPEEKKAEEKKDGGW